MYKISKTNLIILKYIFFSWSLIGLFYAQNMQRHVSVNLILMISLGIFTAQSYQWNGVGQELQKSLHSILSTNPIRYCT